MLKKSRESGQYQFKHLSFQEYLAAAELVHDFEPAAAAGARPVVRSWPAACAHADNTPAANSEPFWRFLVEKYVRFNEIRIDPRSVKTSVLRYAKGDNAVMRRVLVSASPFPSGCSNSEF